MLSSYEWLIAQWIALAATDTTYLRFLLPISSMQMIRWEENQLPIASFLWRAPTWWYRLAAYYQWYDQ